MKKLLTYQTLLIAAGAVFAWYNVIRGFLRFYDLEGTIFKIKDCAIPNPVTQACFYGALGFIIAFAISLIIYKSEALKAKKIQHYLWWFLSAGAIFGWYNVVREFVAFYSSKTGEIISCSATPVTNPFLTPCFTGATIYLLAAILAGFIYGKYLKNQN